MVSSSVAGSVGLFLSGTLWSVASWRLLFHLAGCINRENGFNSWLKPRRVFHILLWIGMSVEMAAYADLSGLCPLSTSKINAEKWGHVMLDMIGRSMFEFMAFSLVTVLWFRTSAEARAVSTAERNIVLDGFPILLILSCILLIFCSLLEAVTLLSSNLDLLTYQQASWIYRVCLFSESLAWGVHTLLVFTCVFITAMSILQLSAFPQTGTLTRMVLLLKPLLPMVLCGFCYVTRSAWLSIRLIRLLYSSTVKPPDLLWWVGFVWIPTIVPSAMVLYSARKRDQSSASEIDEDDIALLTPVPPAEAFLAFRRVADGADSSPLAPRCITAQTPEADYLRLAESDDEES